MDVAHLQEYVALARNGSFTETARSLHITQSTLSKHIAALEREFGCELLVRGKAGCALTAAGELLYEHALDILSAVERARHEVPSTAAAHTGKAIDLAESADFPLRRACAQAAHSLGRSEVQAAALARYLEGASINRIAIELECARDDVGIMLAEWYRALGVGSREQAFEKMHSYLE